MYAMRTRWGLARETKMRTMALTLIFSGFSAFVAVAALIYLEFFLMDLSFLPVTINRHPHTQILPHYPAINNIVLLLIFTLQHSLMARPAVQQQIKKFLPSQSYGSLYALCSGLLVIMMMICWAPITTVVWNIESWLKYVILGLNVIDHILLMIVFAQPFTLHMLGLEPVLYKVFGWNQPAKQELITSGLFGVVRHPIYFFTSWTYWLHPHMTLGHFLMAAVLTLYMVLAVEYYEEPKLMAEFGKSYIEYKKNVPKYIPFYKSIFRV